MGIIAWARMNAKKWPCLEYLHMVRNGSALNHKTELQRQIIGSRLKKMGIVSGVFDLRLDHAAGGYHGLAIEVKTPRGVLSESQRKYGDFLRCQGYNAIVVRSIERGIEQLTEYLQMPPTRCV
jgi:VRR-NUC domain